MADLRAAARALKEMAVIFGIGQADFFSIGSTVRGYQDELTNAVYDVMNGRQDKYYLRRTMKGLLLGNAYTVYVEGFREAGADEEDIDQEDLTRIDNWLNDQLFYMNDFVDAVASVKGDRDLMPAIIRRIDFWVSSLRNLGQQASLIAQGNPILVFDGDDGKESCIQCKRYKGQSHHLDWWRQRGLLERNGNPYFGCGRWEGYCNHHFYNRKGEMVLA